MKPKGLSPATKKYYLEAKRQNVTSSNIKSIGYLEEHKTLIIEFHNQDIWAYMGVSNEVHENVLYAVSIGKAFNEHIKFNKEISQFNLLQ